MSSNGTNGKSGFHPPAIAAETQRMLDRHRESRLTEQTIREELDASIAVIMMTHRTHGELIATLLESYAARIRSDIESQKLKDREERRGGR